MRTPSLSAPATARVGAAALALVLLVAVVVAGLVWWRDEDTRLSQALQTAPASSQRFGFVDWAGVRAELDGGDGGVTRLLERAYERDLSAPSALLSSAEGLEQVFGLSPATLQWEAFAQGNQGASLALKVPEGFDFSRLSRALERAGFTRPGEDALGGGVWEGGPDVLARLDQQLTPELAHWALLPEEQMVVTSDQPGWVPHAVEAARGGEQVRESMVRAAGASGEALSSIVLRGDYTCEYLAMSQAGDGDQARGERLVTDAGGVDPLTAYGLSLLGDRRARAVMTFADDETARENADSRATLASGPAPGQGGEFSDRFRLKQTTAEGNVVRLLMQVRPGRFLLSDLGSGPVLFATC